MNQELVIRKWCVYFADIKFIEIDKIKERPIIVLGVFGINALVLPLTSSAKKIYWSDIIFNFNNIVSVAKITNIQRIHIKDIKRNLIIYSENGNSYARIPIIKRREISNKFNALLFKEVKKDIILDQSNEYKMVY